MTVKRSGDLDKNLQRVDFGIRNGLALAGQLVLTSVDTVFERNKPRGIASGELRQSMTKTAVVLDGTRYKIRIGPSALHGQYVFYGRKPGKFPPIDAILQWIDTKGITPTIAQKRNKTGRFRKSTRSDVNAAKRNLAFLIARKIATQGIVPYPYLTVGYNLVKDKIPGIIIEQIKTAIKGA